MSALFRTVTEPIYTQSRCFKKKPSWSRGRKELSFKATNCASNTSNILSDMWNKSWIQKSSTILWFPNVPGLSKGWWCAQGVKMLRPPSSLDQWIQASAETSSLVHLHSFLVFLFLSSFPSFPFIYYKHCISILDKSLYCYWAYRDPAHGGVWSIPLASTQRSVIHFFKFLYFRCKWREILQQRNSKLWLVRSAHDAGSYSKTIFIM